MHNAIVDRKPHNKEQNNRNHSTVDEDPTDSFGNGIVLSLTFTARKNAPHTTARARVSLDGYIVACPTATLPFAGVSRFVRTSKSVLLFPFPTHVYLLVRLGSAVKVRTRHSSERETRTFSLFFTTNNSFLCLFVLIQLPLCVSRGFTFRMTSCTVYVSIG